MKKVLFLLGCCLALTGCAHYTASQAAEGTVTEPPVLTVRAGETAVEANQGSLTWEYDWGKDSSSKESVTTSHPLERQEFIPTLTTAETAVTLSFSEECDSYTVRCWSDAYWDQPETEAKEAVAEENVLTLLPGGYVYEVTAQWSSAPTHRGTVSYAFHVVAE